ncbi:MAG: sensor histidine kinase [Chromatiales bacterium]|nr:sensor histidine kinase [Chromatiales bacterium]
MSFSRQFLLVSAALLLLAMVVTGNWLAMEIERSAVNRATAVAAVYVESILAAQLRHATTDALLTDDAQEVLDGIFIEGPLRRKVMRFKLWDAEGVIRYSSDHVQQGRRFPVDGLLAAAFGGTVQARISGLDEDDNLSERAYWPRLLEVYVPVRAAARGEVVAVAEFYHSTENIDREILAAQQRIWILVVVATLAIYLLLLTLVRRANDTIVQQRDDLCRQLQQLRSAFEENERMRTRLGEAGAATTTLNEHLLHRIAADLHDGPAQTLAFSLMRFDERTAHCGCADRAACETSSELHAIRGALRSSLDDLRNIAAGLGLPGITDLSLADTARRAVRDFERRTDVHVAAEIDDTLRHAGLATKITVYRLLQESLSNSARHAPGSTPQVRAWREGDQVRIEVSDRGAGFDPAAAARSGRLGLAFMQERVRLLGGHFEVESAPGCGTHVRAGLPLAADEVRHD